MPQKTNRYSKNNKTILKPSLADTDIENELSEILSTDISAINSNKYKKELIPTLKSEDDDSQESFEDLSQISYNKQVQNQIDQEIIDDFNRKINQTPNFSLESQQFNSSHSHKYKSTLLAYLSTHQWLVISILLFLGAIIMLILGFNNREIRNQILTSNLKIEVVDNNQKPIPLASVKINSQDLNIITITDNLGILERNNLPVGNHQISIEANGYKNSKFEQNFTIWHPTKLKVVLDIATTADISGKLNTKTSLDEAVIDTINLTIAGQKVKPTIDGSFQILDLPLGKTEVVVESPYFQKFNTEIDLKPGLNQLPAFDLQPNINLPVKIVDWLNKKPIQEVTINYNQKTIKTDETGIAIIEQVENQAELEINLSNQNYLSKTQKITANKEINLNNPLIIEMVRIGKIAYTSDRNGNQVIYVANLDGSDEVQISEDGYWAKNPIILGDKVLYQSNKDNLKDIYRNLIEQVYEADLDGKNTRKLTQVKGSFYDQNQEVEQSVYIRARKILTYKSTSRNEQEFPDNINQPFITSLEISDFDGKNKKEIYYFEEAIDSGRTTELDIYCSALSTDGKWLAINQFVNYRDKYNPIERKVLLINTQSGAKTEIFNDTDDQIYSCVLAISGDGSKVIYGYRYYEGDKNIYEIYDRITKKTSKIKDFSQLNTESFVFTEDNQKVLFLSTRDNNDSLYIFDLNKNKTSKLVETEKTTAFSTDFEKGLIYIRDDNKLKAIDYQTFDIVEISVLTNFNMLPYRIDYSVPF